MKGKYWKKIKFRTLATVYLKGKNMADLYDCIIVGAGPAGLGAALYSARDNFKTLVLEKFFPGGQIINTDKVENYPGIDSIDGPELAERLKAQALKFNAEILMGKEVTALKKLDDGKIEVTSGDHKYLARTVILAPGSGYRKLSIPGEDEFRNAGSGVSYCGTCDAPFFRGKEVVSIGGGNTAIEETLHLAKFADKVTLIHRRDQFRATRILVDELMEKVNQPNSNITVKYSSVATRIEGADKVQSITLKDLKTEKEEDYPCNGVFIFVGMIPNTKFLKGSIELTDAGFIKCESTYMRTAIPGVFAAGDCRVGAAMQLVTAINDGVVAAMMQKQYFRDPNWWNAPATDILQPGGW